MTEVGPHSVAEPGPYPTSAEWTFSLAGAVPGDDLIALGADLAPGTLFAAYTTGLFPMGVGEHGADPLGWWSPDPRGILRSGQLRVSRSLRKSARRFEIRVDTAFDQVVAACASPDRPSGWITAEIAAAYGEVHRAGWAHSVETWFEDELVGGLYGISIGGLFAGESMFHHVTDASKVALLGLHQLITEDGDPRRIIDVQWRTDHLASLGVEAVPRRDYLALLGEALSAPLPPRWAPKA